MPFDPDAVSKVIVLDRIEPGAPEPDYCVHGRATCMGGCGEWVWLGSETHKVVASGDAVPLCRPCAQRIIPAGPDRPQPMRRVVDHLRSDGPHQD